MATNVTLSPHAAILQKVSDRHQSQKMFSRSRGAKRAPSMLSCCKMRLVHVRNPLLYYRVAQVSMHGSISWMLINSNDCGKGAGQYAGFSDSVTETLTSTDLAMYRDASFGRCRACVSMTSGPEKSATTSAPAHQQGLSPATANAWVAYSQNIFLPAACSNVMRMPVRAENKACRAQASPLVCWT